MKGAHKKLYDQSKILYEIYRMRALTIAQLSKVVFKSRIYAYRYLQKMEDYGLLSYMYDTDGRKRLAKVYVCTDKAIEILEKEGFIEKGVKAKDNMPQKAKLKFTIFTNEVYAALMPYGIYMYDSREWKRKHNMDRNSMVRGGLKMTDGREMGLYLFFSKDQFEGASFSPKMLERFKGEVKKFPQTNRIAVICYDQEIYKEIVNALDKDETALVNEELLVIPIGKDEFGYNLLRMSRNEEERKTYLETVLNTRLNKKHEALKGNKQLFAQYVADDENQETYVVDFLSMNRPVIQNLIIHYFDKAYEMDGRPVNLVCWKASEKELASRFTRYPHIRITSVQTKSLKEIYIPSMSQKKLL